MNLLNISMLLLGLAAGVLLFRRFPRLPQTSPVNTAAVSIIIPARNEEANIGNLLSDLQKQKVPIHEIICVDDGSTDGTRAIIRQFPVTCLPIHEKPPGWMGKTYACQKGAEAATGQLLIFLDADLRLGPDTIQALAAQCQNQVVSVQPYHEATHFYEYFAFFFNAVGIGANGAACPASKQKAGLFGPVIGMPKQQFQQIGGYSQVKNSVIEDVELGRVLQQNHLKYSLYIGDKSLRFRMYQNFKELFLGFTKNYSSGAAHTPLLLLLLTLLWIIPLSAAPLLVVQQAIAHNLFPFLLASGFYLAYVAQLMLLCPKIGSFKTASMLVYPLFLLVFHGVFFYSLYSKLFRKKVFWKGREISLKK